MHDNLKLVVVNCAMILVHLYIHVRFKQLVYS